MLPKCVLFFGAVPAKLTNVPEGWRLGKLDEVKDSQDKYLDMAEDNFKHDAPKVEKKSTQVMPYSPVRRCKSKTKDSFQ
eukprot:1186575-Prorocentrum_minimum.AAC.6